MYFFVAFILVIILYIFVFYRYIISSKNNVTNALQELDNSYKARWELISLYLDYANINNITEQDLVAKISNIIKTNYDEIDSDNKISINNDLSIELDNLNLVYETYPIIQKDKEFLDLSRQIAKSNYAILKSMENYNKSVTDFNELIDTFPMNLVAKAFKFEHCISIEIQTENTNPRFVKQTNIIFVCFIAVNSNYYSFLFIFKKY